MVANIFSERPLGDATYRTRFVSGLACRVCFGTVMYGPDAHLHTVVGWRSAVHSMSSGDRGGFYFGTIEGEGGSLGRGDASVRIE